MSKEHEVFKYEGRTFHIFIEYSYEQPYSYEIHQEGTVVGENLHGSIPKEWSRQAFYKEVKRRIIDYCNKQ